MADARYVIDLIINARNDTARALQAAASSLGDFNKEIDRMERESGQAFDKLTDKIDGSRKSLKTLNEEGVSQGRTVAAQLRSAEQNAQKLGLQIERTKDSLKAANIAAEEPRKKLSEAEQEARKLNAQLEAMTKNTKENSEQLQVT